MIQEIGLILSFLTVAVNTQSILFPHGYFDSNKISAVDAFYLNMLAVSTVENGGIAIDDLDELTSSRIAPEKIEPGSLKEKVHQVEMEKESVNLAAGKPFIENVNPLVNQGVAAPVVVKERPLTKEILNPEVSAPVVENKKPLFSQTSERGLGLPVAISETPLPKEKERPLTKDNRPPTPFNTRVLRDDAAADAGDFNPFEEIATRAPPTPAPPLQRILSREQILGVSGSRPRHRVGVPHEGEMSEQGWMHPRRRRPYIHVDLSKTQIVELPLPPDI